MFQLTAINKPFTLGSHEVSPIGRLFSILQHICVDLSGLQNSTLLPVPSRILPPHPVTHPKHSDNTHPVAQRGCCQSRPARRRILHAEGRARDDTCKVTQPNQKPRSGCSRRFRQIVVVVPATKSAMCNEDSNAILTTSAPRLKECMRPTPSGSKQSMLRPCAPVRRCLPKPPSQ
jgi:hypothetical protein